MTEQDQTETTSTTNAGTSDGTQNTDTDARIPKSRFDEVNNAKKALEDKLKQYEAVDAQRLEAERLAKGEHEQIIADLKPKAERAAALEASLQTYLDAEIADIPDDKRDLIPDGDVTEKLRWVKNAKAKGVFGVPRAPQTDAGTTGDKPPAPATQAQQRAAAVAKEYGYSLDPAKLAERQKQIEQQRQRKPIGG